MRKEERKRIEAFKMLVWRRMAKDSRTEKKTKEEVLRMTGQNRKPIETIMDRKKNWIGHELRRDGLMLEVTEARMIGKRGRGRKRIGMLVLPNLEAMDLPIG